MSGKNAPIPEYGRQFRLELAGRSLRIWEYGDPEGRPVLYLHGWPSSGRDAMMIHEAALAAHARIIAPDRPGIGGSDFQENRTLADWPPIASRLADALGWERFHLVAISGGTLYGYATVHALADRIIGMAVVCGALPLAEMPDHSRLHPSYRLLLWLYRHHPDAPLELLRLAAPAARLQWPAWCAWPLTRSLPAPDRAALGIPFIWQAVSSGVRDSFHQSARGTYLDALVNIRPLGFHLEDIHQPVHFWHGRLDRNFAVEDAAAVAARLPNCKTRFLESDGHFSLACLRSGQALRELLAG